MKNIYGITIDELEDYLTSISEQKFKKDQIFNWVYKKKIKDFSSMRNIKKETLAKLDEDFYFGNLKLVSKKEGKDVSKYLFKLEDDLTIEAVLMYQNYGNSLCISTQVGCNMNCLFCESGKLKKVRNLKASEMVMQILEVEKEIQNRVSRVVLMGIGEPFDNYEEVVKFLEIANNNKGIDIGARHITVSTCGITPKIIDFANLNTQVNLAISLHAADNETRDKLMPINKAYDINSLIEALKYYISKTNRRVTFEYIMLKDINDSKEDAIKLAKLIKGMNAYVNLIPYNETSAKLSKTSKEDVLKFYDVLKKQKINVTVRREFGEEVLAACGQLKSKYEEDK